MRVCIVCAGAVRNMVMVSMFTDYLDKEHISYDMIFMDKYHEEETTSALNNYRFEYNGKTVKGKICGYLGFIKYTKEIVINNRYNFLLVWGELTAALFFSFLSNKYKNRFCINIRDLFVGKRKMLNVLLNKAISYSCFVTVSSEKYLEKLPKNPTKYLFVHSFNEKIMQECILHKRKYDSPIDKITILYIGNIRFYQHLYQLIDAFSNDQRFEILIVGYGSEPVEKYRKSKQIKNVFVSGVFPKEKTAEYLNKADVIYNLYGTEDINLRMALSNKLYYALYLNLPILVYKDTYMYEVSSKCGIGFPVDSVTKEELADSFYQWYTNLNKKQTEILCNNLIQEARNSQIQLIKKLSSVLNQVSD